MGGTACLLCGAAFDRSDPALEVRRGGQAVRLHFACAWAAGLRADAGGRAE